MAYVRHIRLVWEDYQKVPWWFMSLDEEGKTNISSAVFVNTFWVITWAQHHSKRNYLYKTKDFDEIYRMVWLPSISVSKNDEF